MKTLIIAILLCAGTLAHGDEPVGALEIVKTWAPTFPGLRFMGVMPTTKHWLFMFTRAEYLGYPAMPLAVVVPPNCTPKQFNDYVVTATWAQFMTLDALNRH
jgi:hypothetical protein